MPPIEITLIKIENLYLGDFHFPNVACNLNAIRDKAMACLGQAFGAIRTGFHHIVSVLSGMGQHWMAIALLAVGVAIGALIGYYIWGRDRS